MICFYCKSNMKECKSKYGFYYFCPNCERTFETESQKDYNSQKFPSRSDYKK